VSTIDIYAACGKDGHHTEAAFEEPFPNLSTELSR